MSEYVEKLDYLEETKALIREAIVEKGVDVSESDSFRSYAEKIEEITTGGGSGEIPRGKQLTRDDFPLSNAVKERRIKAPFTFYDYDGTVLGQYTKAEIDAMTSEDDFPTPVGNNIGDGIDEYPLTFVGWNWTLDELKAEPYGINVGAIYAHILDDGTQSPATIFMNVTEEVTFKMGESNTINSNMVVDIYNRSTGEVASSVTLTKVTTITLPAGKYEARLKITSDMTPYGRSSKMFNDTAALPYIEGISIGNTYQCANAVSPFVSYDTNVKFVCCNAVYGSYLLPLRQFTCDHFNHNKMSNQIELCNCKTVSFNTTNTVYIEKGERLEELLIPSNALKVYFKTSGSLKELYVPEGCFINSSSSAQSSSFYGLEEIYLEDGSDYGTCNFDKSSITALYLPDMPSINSGTRIRTQFLPVTIKKLRLPENLPMFTGTDNYSLIKGMPELESIYLPDSLTTLGPSSFMNCKNLKSIYIPDSITNISAGCFASTNLTLDKIRLPEGIQISPTLVFADTPITEPYRNITFTGTTGYGPYGGCKYLAGEITVPEGVTTLQDGNMIPSAVSNYEPSSSFGGCYNLSKINLPSTLISIGKHAFSGCSNLREINIPNAVTAIKANAFEWCKNLTIITIPDKVTSLGKGTTDGYIFANCSSLKEVNLPEGLLSIGGNCFDSCKSLTTITIPSTVKDMNGSSIFSSCEKLIEYHMKPTTPPTLGGYAFGYSSTLPATGAKIYVPYSEDHSILAAYQTATNWSKWAKYIVEEPTT